jgi:hypothetical protein
MVSPNRAQGRPSIVLWLQRHPGLGEFGLVGGCLLIYFLIRASGVSSPSVAFSHAIDVIDLERRVGILWEPAWQDAIRGNLTQINLWNYIYFWAHAPVIAVIAFWLFARHRRQYTLIRNAFLISALIGLCIYAVYPVAPPRLMTPAGYAEFGVNPSSLPNFGVQDTMREFSHVSYQAESLKPFVNPFAAMPSLHFGWAFLIGLGVGLGARNLLGFLFAVALPAFMLVAIVMTANHFIFDALVGWVVVGFALLVALGLERLPERFRQKLTPAFLRPAPALPQPTFPGD